MLSPGTYSVSLQRPYAPRRNVPWILGIRENTKETCRHFWEGSMSHRACIIVNGLEGPMTLSLPSHEKEQKS